MKILFLGDFLYDYDSLNDDIKILSEYIKSNNLITILNLEGPLKSNKKWRKPINLYSSPRMIEALNLLNVKAVNLANNHIMDFCEEGLAATIEALDNAGIGYFGAGANISEAIKPYVLEINNKKIFLYGFGWNMEESINAKKNKAGTAPLNFKFIRKIINNTNSDCVIPVFHFGYEYEKLPQPIHVKECRSLKNNRKVKAIISHHPHVIQAYDKDYNIFYSLGNFYFGTMRKKYTKEHPHFEEVNKGIGVILDSDTWEANIIKISSFNEFTEINENIEINNFEDISGIATENYQKYFYKNNNIINKKYIYKIGCMHEKVFNKTNKIRRNMYKFYLRKIKWPLGRKLKKILRRTK